MKKTSSIIWGIILIAAGILIALNVMNVTDIDIFFNGWWTLFIIVPCCVGLFTEREKTGNLIGIAIGVCLLLASNDIISFSLLWKLLVPAIVILIGLRMIWGGVFGNKVKKLEEKNGTPRRCCAAFSGSDLRCDGEIFEGAELTAVFGGVECDLRHAVIAGDCTIRATAVFGGIDILLPANVNVKVGSTSFFGGVTNKTVACQDAPTIYISGICAFGGVDVK